MGKSSRIFIAIFSMALPLAQCWAATAIHATVRSAGLYGNGALFITFDGGPIPEPGCDGQSSRIDIPASNPRIKEFLALALTAQATGRRLYVNVNGCDPQTGRPTLDNSYTSFMYLTD